MNSAEKRPLNVKPRGLDACPLFFHDIAGMDECPLTRCYLESLTTRELTVLADQSGVDIPPGLDRPFIIEEILEAESDDENDAEGREEAFQEVPPEEAEFLDSAPLPEQYNITYIKVLIRDPLWVFAFWEIKSHDRELYEKGPDFEGYFLKVSPAAEICPGGVPPRGGVKTAPSRGKHLSDLSFTVPVGPGDTAWYLGFPPEYSGKDAAGKRRFRVELGVRRGTGQEVLAVSRPFNLPFLLSPPEAKAPRSPLAGLSAMDELRILRNGERRSRLLGDPR
jgi:hypothetical protein